MAIRFCCWALLSFQILMRSCMFLSVVPLFFNFYYLFSQIYTLITKIVFSFRKSKSISSINSQTHCIENNWPNFDKNYNCNGWERMWEWRNQIIYKVGVTVWVHMVPAKEELELINVGTKQDKREMKIRILITTKVRNELVALL